MIKALVLRKEGKIRLVPETDEDEEQIRMFALEEGIPEDEFCAKNTSVSLTPPILSGGRKVSRRVFNIQFQSH